MLPGFWDYRRTIDGIMVADLGFKKQLWMLDKELDVVWDWGSCKWEIWKFPGQGGKKVKKVDRKAFHIMTVQTKDKKFKELGADVLLKLQAGDTRKFGVKQLFDYFEKMDDNIQRAKRKELVSAIEARTKEAMWYTAGLRVQVPRRFQDGILLNGSSQEQKVIGVLGNA